MNKDFIFTGAHRNQNWFYNQFYYNGSNYRYTTFNIALNLLNQQHPNPTIIETGCQRQKDDIGGGMSTTIFAEYLSRYNGKLISVDLSPQSCLVAKQVIAPFIEHKVNISIIESDSVKFLAEYQGSCDLLYLDSFDYPYGELLNKYGGQTDIVKAEKLLWDKNPELLIEEFSSVILPCQQHCVNEFLAIKDRLNENTILLLDDNLLPGGGKPRLLKEMLPDLGWTCLLDFQQSLWIRKI